MNPDLKQFTSCYEHLHVPCKYTSI